MLDFTKGEEKQVERAIAKELADTGLRVVIAGAGVGELALHYLNLHGILAFKVPSKFDLRRLCRVVGATPLPRLGAPMPEELGVIDTVESLSRLVVTESLSSAKRRRFPEPPPIVLRSALRTV